MNMTTVTTSLLTERDEDIFIIKLHRPDKFNALNTQLREELVAAIESVRHDDSVRAVIIWGGHEVFAAGADLEEMVSRTPMQAMRQINNGPDMRSEEHTSELQSLMRISYAVFCLKK